MVMIAIASLLKIVRPKERGEPRRSINCNASLFETVTIVGHFAFMGWAGSLEQDVVEREARGDWDADRAGALLSRA